MAEKLASLRKKGGGDEVFKHVYIAGGLTNYDLVVSRGYNTDSTGTVTGAYDTDYVAWSDVNDVNYFKAKVACKAMVIEGYNTASYTIRNYAVGDTFGTVTRRTAKVLFIGIYK